jgi:hypothetical protein
MQTGFESREFRPELLSRRGEITAWGLTLLLGIVATLLNRQGVSVFPAAAILEVILLVSALIISLNNWVDRRTVIRLDSEGIYFENGLRRVRFAWNEVRQVRVYLSELGKKIIVYGPRTYFTFHTLGEVKLRGEVRGRMGFPQGERILRLILEAGGLSEERRSGSGSIYDRG